MWLRLARHSAALPRLRRGAMLAGLGQSIFRLTLTLCAVVTLSGCGRQPSDAGQTTSQPKTGISERPASDNDWFVDRAESAGLNFVYDNGMSGHYYFPEMLGGGAALGGLLGAIAGGGKGAVIGAVAGAAAGGAVQVLTKGDRVRVPAETVLKFDLDEPARLELLR